jgi:integrase
MYVHAIRRFVDFAKKYDVDVENLKETYRRAKYQGEKAREQFLDKVQDVVEMFLSNMKALNYPPLRVKHDMSVISSYLKKGCGIRDIEVPIPKRVFVKYHNRDITKEEIRKILEHCSIRDKAFFILMVESGLRPNTILQLRYKHVKDDFEKGVVPMRILLPSEILKDRISSRFTFIGEDGFRILKEYLSPRMPLQDNDLLFLPEKPHKATHETVGVSAMSQKFNKLVLKLKLDTPIQKGKPKSLRLYCLRKYFWNNMRCDTSFKSFWFCHSSIDDHYISTMDIERHREEYRKGYPYLRIYEPTTPYLTPDQVKQIVMEFLKTEEGQALINQRIAEWLRKAMEGAEVVE